MNPPFRRLATLLLMAMCPWSLMAEDVELFYLDDGRELVGTYDAAAGKLSVITSNGYIVVDVAKESIVRRKPAVIPEYSAPPAPAEDAGQVTALPVRAAHPVPKPVAKAQEPPMGLPQQSALNLDFARQKLIQLQQAAAAGNPAAQQQLQQAEKLIEQYKRKSGR